MKTILIALLSLHFATGGLLLQETAHADAMIHHYQQHRSAKSAENLWQFIALHYFNAAHGQQDRPTHNQLPFLSVHNTPNLYFRLQDSLHLFPPLRVTCFTLPFPVAYSFRFSTTIDQPPCV